MVDKATMVSDVFSEFHSILNSNVTSVSVSGGTVDLRESSNGNHWYGAYPDTSLITDKEEYPIGVITTPTFNQSIEGYNYDEADFTFDISVFATRAENAPKVAEKAWNEIRKKQNTLESAELYLLETGNSTQEVIVDDRGGLKIHNYIIPVQVSFGSSA